MLCKKRISVFSILICLTLGLSANAYDDFMAIQSGLITDNAQFLTEQRTVTVDENGKTSDETQITGFHRKGATFAILTPVGGSSLFFLNTDGGYYMMSKRMKTPLKIAGNYRQNGLDVQELLDIEYDKNYKVVEEQDGTVFLERTSKKMAYPRASIEETESSSQRAFRVLFYDLNNTPVREPYIIWAL